MHNGTCFVNRVVFRIIPCCCRCCYHHLIPFPLRISSSWIGPIAILILPSSLKENNLVLIRTLTINPKQILGQSSQRVPQSYQIDNRHVHCLRLQLSKRSPSIFLFSSVTWCPAGRILLASCLAVCGLAVYCCAIYFASTSILWFNERHTKRR